MSPDEREIEFPESEKAIRGTPLNNYEKSASTWLYEANRNVNHGIDYYRIAADNFEKAGNSIAAESYRNLANAITQAKKECIEWLSGNEVNT